MPEQVPRRLDDVLESVAQQMLADFKATSMVEHRGSKGSLREEAFVEKYLKKYLPRNVLPILGGEVVSSDGQVSGQCDVLIVDPSTPPLYESNNYRVVPVECVYGAIEIKSHLSSQGLREAWAKAAYLKSFPKAAFIHIDGARRPYRRVYGKEWMHVPTSSMIFAYDSDTLDALGGTLADLADGTDPETRIDSVWVLKRGCLVWVDPSSGNIDVCPKPLADFDSIEASPEQVLMHLTAHLHQHYGTAWMPYFDILQYLQGSWGETRRRWVDSEGATKSGE